MESALAAADELLRKVPLIDGHNDLAWAVRINGHLGVADLDRLQPSLQTDLVRLHSGRVGGQFWSVYVPCRFKGSDAIAATIEQIEFVHRMIEHYPNRLSLATGAKQVEDAFAAGRVASLLGAEGGHCIGESLEILRAFYRLGVRYLTLTHNENTSWAESATDVAIGGLRPFGYEVISEMNLLGMLVDLAHTSRSTALASIRASRAPAVITHSSCRSLVDHPRNVDDETLRARLAANFETLEHFARGWQAYAAERHPAMARFITTAPNARPSWRARPPSARPSRARRTSARRP